MEAQRCVRKRAWRVGIAAAVASLLLSSLSTSTAHTSGGFEDHFSAPNGTLLVFGPTASQWVVDPISLATQWVIETRPTSVSPALGTTSVLVGRSRALTPTEPIAFVKKDMHNFVFQARAAFDRTVPGGAGVGVVFRAPVDPNTGVIDRQNLYLLTSVNVAPNPRAYPTGHAFILLKRVAGTYYMATRPVDTWMDFSNSAFHLYKVAMVNDHIQAWIDGVKLFDIVDSPGDDTVPGTQYKMPGPPFVTGAVGLRTSGTQALFDDVVVAGSPAYEGRAAALNMYGQVGHLSGQNNQQTGVVPTGTEQTFSGGDTDFQYHDHDFNTSQNDPVTSPAGNMAVATLRTRGGVDPVTGLEQTSSDAELTGLGGVFTDPNGRVTVTLAADLVRAHAAATCEGWESTVDVVNLTWEVVYKDGNGNTQTIQGNTTKFNAVPNTNLLDAGTLAGPFPSVPNGPNPNTMQLPVRLTLHSRSSSTDPQRVDVAGIRVTFLQSTDLAPDRVSAPGNVMADVGLSNVVAGKFCE